jgi:hypothetical protein
MGKVATGAVVVATGAAVAVQPQPVSPERRGVELAASVLRKVEQAIERCTREAEAAVNGTDARGMELNEAFCQEVKVEGIGQTWGMYLGLRKHHEVKLCLRKALGDLLEKKRLWLEPIFYLNPRTGRWEYMSEDMASQILSREGWKGLEGTIKPDIVLVDAAGIVLQVYDMKFPCPPGNAGGWHVYEEGRWIDWHQNDLYWSALGVYPSLVTPQKGIKRDARNP